MGIDIYARWTGQSENENKEQFTGFSVLHGRVGYLRESYGGGPYATRYLVPEAFAADDREATIPAAVLRERLPRTLELVEERVRTFEVTDPKEIAELKQSFVDFVALCEAKEKETGSPCRICASF